MRKILLTLLVTFFTLFANAVEVRWYNATSDKPQYQTITYSEVGTDSATAAYIIKTNATASNTMVKTTANGSGKSGYWSAKTTVSGSDFCDSIYVTFQVKSGYTFTFTHLSNFVAKVAGTATFKGFIKDNNGHELTSSQSSSTSDVNISFTSMSGTSFSGIVKVGLAFFSNEKSYKSVYLDDNLQFTGSISSSGGSTTYTVTYNGNGNTGGTAPTDASSPYAAGSNVTVLGNTGSLVKTGYTFDGWNTADDGSGADYAAAATISSIAANTTLYAKWTCAATVPGNISKGSACAGEDLTLTSAGSPASGDTWYWQASSTGTSTTNSGTTYDVSEAGTYYIRSYNGTCWSAAKSVTVAAGDWTSPSISGASSVTIGNTITLTGSPSGGTWNTSDNTKATVNPSGVVSGVAIGNTNITYTKDGCTSDNHAVTVSAACTDPDLTITLN